MGIHELRQDRPAFDPPSFWDPVAKTFGPNWRAVVTVLTWCGHVTQTGAAFLDSHWQRSDEWNRDIAQDWARLAASAYGREEMFDVAEAACAVYQHERGRPAVRAAVAAVVTWDLASDDWGYTSARRGILIGPWLKTFDLPVGLS